MAWDYAELSKLAKANGGPEKLIEILIKSGEKAGGKKMLPWVGVALAGGVALTVGVQKIIQYFKQKKAISTVELESAKEELIQGINDYDASQLAKENKGECKMPKLLYQGHGSFRITAADGRVIYVDPYVGEGYDLPADIILVSHQHRDHNCIDLCKQNDGCTIISNVESLADGKQNSFCLNGIEVQAVEAYNKNHKPDESVGFIITVDGIKIYASGDTSKTKQMESFAEMNLDYALFCGDGVYNMNPEEAAECAEIIGAKNNIIIHLTPGQLFDRPKAEAWTAPNKLIVGDGEEIELLKS